MSPLQGIEAKNNPAVYHVPLVERELVEILGNEAMFRNAQCLQHGLLPETTAAFDRCEGIDDAKGQYAFHWARHQAQG